MNNKHNYLTHSKRRQKLFKELPENSISIIPNRNLSIRSNDVEYKFKSDPDFFYLTGFEEPNSICILKKDKRNTSYILFVEEKNKEKEIWVGKKAGTSGAKSTYKADMAYSICEFEKKLKSLIQGSEHIYYPIGKHKELDLKITNIVNELKKGSRAGIKTPKEISDPRDLIHKMRLIKDNNEIALMETAAQISRSAHILAMLNARPNIFEYELEAIVEYQFRAQGASAPAYTSIVGSGKNCTVLHYIENNRKVKNGDLILIDAGCEYENYASDVTRTFPANKKFTSIQKDLYEIVLEAQLKSIEQIKPGKRFIDAHEKAVEIIVEGLKELKLLKGNTKQLIEKGEYKKFYMHKTGHWLGLDVHDAGPYIDDKGNSIKLRPGMVTTVEPGIYISEGLDNVPEKFKGIGIRIEDDVLVTSNGNRILTAGTPKTIKEIENLASN